MRELLNTGVNISLEYYDGYDALIGQIKGYSVAVKENLATGSYGCLFWARKGGGTVTAGQYLEEQQKKNPDFLKKFMVNDTGIAVALTRSADDFTNVNNIKRFIYDFTAALLQNNYVNCCCECGAAENLSIYDTGGVIAQACPSCGIKYSFIRSCEDAPAVPAAPATNTVTASEEVKTPDEAPVPAAAEEFSLKEFEYIPEEKAEEPAPIIKETEPADLSSLMFDESEKEEAPAPQISVPAEATASEGFDSLLYEEAKPEPEKPRSLLFEQAEREFAEEKAKMAAEEAKLDSEVDNLIIEGGDIVLKEITPETDDGSHDVTEVHDDSNDGEDFDIEEIESTVEMPTVTTGHPQLEAEETPLEEDGSVPLINPNSHREERHVSPVDGPDAVLPLDYGQATVTYEKLSEETAPRFSAGGDGVNRNPTAASPYNPNANYSSYVRKISYSDSSNAVMGIIGALVLGLVGFVVWIAIAHFLNIISVWGCLAIIFTVYGGYYLGGRALDKKGIVISFILTLVMVLAGVVGMSMFDVIADFKEQYDMSISLKQALDWTINSLKVEDTRKVLVENGLTSIAIALVANIVAAINFFKRA